MKINNMLIKIGVMAALALSLLLAACTTAPNGSSGNTQTPPTTSGTSYTVEITAGGYSPTPLTIKAGDTVTWVNKDTTPHWIASAAHPTHTVYPGSGIDKCGTAEQPNIFDACRGLSQGETFTFTFNEKGSWNYHDHLNVAPPFFGTIVVE